MHAPLRIGLVLGGSILLAGCGGAAPAAPESPVVGEGTASPVGTGLDTATSEPLVEWGTPSPTSRVEVEDTFDVAYETSNDLLTPGVLDVAAPTGAAGLPVVVMLHGSPSAVDKSSLHSEARAVAAEGFVVFVPSWDRGGAAGVTYPELAESRAANAQVACALAFVRDHAADFGGDPKRLILFGHSGGANAATVYAFSPARPSPGCLGAIAPEPAAVVTWDGDFALAAPDGDTLLAAEPDLAAQMMPWGSLASKPDLPVEMLVSGNPPPEYRRPIAATEVPAFLAARDPDGSLAAAATATGVLEDGDLTLVDEQTLFDAALRAQGNPGALAVMPDANHTGAGVEGLRVLVATIKRLAGG